MVGTITSWFGNRSTGLIAGEDGNVYFMHDSDMIGTRKVRKGNIVRFDISEIVDGKHQRAVNIRKIGHGPGHPYLPCLKRLYETVEQADIDAEEKRYQLRDIQMIMNYFEHVPDIEWCEDVRSTFKPEI